jgi:hypothetical protein
MRGQGKSLGIFSVGVVLSLNPIQDSNLVWPACFANMSGRTARTHLLGGAGQRPATGPHLCGAGAPHRTIKLPCDRRDGAAFVGALTAMNLDAPPASTEQKGKERKKRLVRQQRLIGLVNRNSYGG